MIKAKMKNTTADKMTGYPETRKALAEENTKALCAEYLVLQRACLDTIFGHNAKQFQGLIAEELISREVTEIYNMFGPIKIKK